MSPTLLRARDRKAVPWKNGGGVTREIAAHPPGADMAGFDWRVSTAVVASEGPFSSFEGVDRTLLVLTGEGLGLKMLGAPEVVLTPRSDPLAFPADVPVDATLAGGEVSDLNVMVRRGAWTSRVVRRPLTAPLTVGCGTTTCLVLAAGPASLLGVDGATGLDPGDALLLAAGEEVRLAPRGGPGALVVVELARLG